MARMRSAGSSMPTGSTMRARVMRFPPAGSSAFRSDTGMVTRRWSTGWSWRAWYRASPPLTPARKASLTVPPALLPAARRAAKGTSKGS